MKKKALKLFPLLMVSLVSACNSANLNPDITNKDQPIIVGSKDEILGDIYDDLFSGNANNAAFNWVVKEIAERLDIPTARETEINKRIDETKEKWLENTAYYFNDRFYERKLVTSLTNLGYTIPTCEHPFVAADADNNPWNQDPTKRLELKKSDGDDILTCDYTDYEERALKPTIYQQMIEEEYIIQYDRLKELAGAKRVRELETLTFPKDSIDLELGLFIEKISESLQGKTIDFTEFAFPRTDFLSFPYADENTPLNQLSGYNVNFVLENGIPVIPVAKRNDLKVYENIWKNYRKFLNYKERLKLGRLGGPESEETEESKKALQEEKKKIIDKYTSNNTYSIEYGFWKAALEIDKVEYVKKDVYSTDSAPYSGFLKNVLFNKNSDASEDSILYSKIFPGPDRFLMDVNSYDNATGDTTILYQTDNGNNQYVFIRIVDMFENQLAETNDTNYRAANAYAPTISIGKKAFVQYFKDYDLQFGDQIIYDYFKVNYPEYFEKD